MLAGRRKVTRESRSTRNPENVEVESGIATAGIGARRVLGADFVVAAWNPARV
jgi:hypothetical protein